MTDLECCREEDELSSMNYWCTACDQKHQSNGSELYTPCCNCAMCETSFRTRLKRHSAACPSCAKDFPSFMVLNDSNQQLAELSRPVATALTALLFGCSMISWAIAPGLPLAVFAGMLYGILNLLNVCVATYGSTGFCFDAMPSVRAWIMSNPFPSETMHSFFPQPVWMAGFVLLFCSITLFAWAMWSIKIAPFMNSKFRQIMERRFALYVRK